jgi:hypothetical protein
MRLSAKSGLAVLCVLIPCALADAPFVLTTREQVDAKKAEMLKIYTRGENVERFIMYLAWQQADVRFRRKVGVTVHVRTSGVDANDLGLNGAQTRRLEKTIEEAATKMLKERGFESPDPGDDLNMAELTAWIIKPRPQEKVYIVDGDLAYRRELFDRRRIQSIYASMSEQRSLDYTDKKEEIESLLKGQCMRSLENFCNQMRDDETVMEVYYELLAKGLIDKKFQEK